MKTMAKVDFHDIKGLEHCKRGLEVAVAGGHSVLLVGPRKAGKSLLTDAFVDLALELGLPYAIVEDITKTTMAEQATDEQFIIGMMLPCPCGNFTDPKHECKCSPARIHAYLTNISAALLDRIDIHIEVPRLNLTQVSDKRRGESSAEIIARIKAVQDKGYPVTLDREAEELLKLAILELGISARCYDKVIRVARTIALLDNKEIIEAHHISEAISYRSLDRNLWG